jgi:murein DD-endopeptidase MepM/ murein hydrolase activator NlpD
VSRRSEGNPFIMLTRLKIRRALTPVLLTGLITTTTLAAAPQAGAVADSSAGAGAGAAEPSSGSVASESLPELVPPYRIVKGVELKAKPPPWELPVAGYHLTGRFGASSGMWSSTHSGLDFAAPEGAEIRSIGPGVVTQTASDGAFGNKTVVRLDDGTVLWYCHQSEFAAEKGQRLAPGDLIGYVGSTGNVTGPHLHLEVHSGDKPVDPESWLVGHGLHA